MTSTTMMKAVAVVQMVVAVEDFRKMDIMEPNENHLGMGHRSFSSNQCWNGAENWLDHFRMVVKFHMNWLIDSALCVCVCV